MRTFGDNERIVVTFDITRPLSESFEDEQDDEELEEDVERSRGQNARGAANEEEDEDLLEDDEEDATLAVTVDVTKPNQGTLTFFMEQRGDYLSVR